MKFNLKNRALLKNTAMLYVLQFSTYFFSLVTVPYQTRIMGPAIYGKVGVAFAFIAYFQLFLDFGFMLSATADVSRNRNDKEYVSKIFTSITLIKLFFSTTSLLFMGLLCLTIDKFRAEAALYFAFLISTIIGSFLPDYIYRGVEKMTAITVRALLIRLFSTVCIFIFLKKPEDYTVVPTFLLIGNLGAVTGVFIHLKKKLGIWFKRVTFEDMFADLKKSSSFFFSRIATTVYTVTNTVIIDFIDSTGLSTGFYTSADKLVTASKNCFSPISDSLYPYMIKNRDFKMVKKVLGIFMPLILTGCIIVWIFAEPLCVFIFGRDFAGAGRILRALLPVVAVILPSYILGFPTLGAMGLAKYANYSIYIGTVIQLSGIIVLYLSGAISVMSLSIMTSASEVAVFLFRLFTVVKNSSIFNNPLPEIIADNSRKENKEG